MPKKIVIPEDAVEHQWKCPNRWCQDSATVGPSFYQESGTPYCGDCDRDMIFVRAFLNLTPELLRKLNNATANTNQNS